MDQFAVLKRSSLKDSPARIPLWRPRTGPTQYSMQILINNTSVPGAPAPHITTYKLSAHTSVISWSRVRRSTSSRRASEAFLKLNESHTGSRLQDPTSSYHTREWPGMIKFTTLPRKAFGEHVDNLYSFSPSGKPRNH